MPQSQHNHHPNSNDRLATSTAAFVTFFKSLFGAGILALPNVVGEVGLILGVILYFTVAVTCSLTCYMLLRARELTECHLVAEMLTDELVLAVDHDFDEDDTISVLANNEEDLDEEESGSLNRNENGEKLQMINGHNNTNNKKKKKGEDARNEDQRHEKEGNAIYHHRRHPTNNKNGYSKIENGNGIPSPNQQHEQQHKDDDDDHHKITHHTPHSTHHSSQHNVTHLVTYGDLSAALLSPLMATITRWTIITLHILFTAGLVIVATENLADAFDWDVDGTMKGRHIIGVMLFPFAALMVQIPWLQDMYLISAMGLVVYCVGVMGSTILGAITSLLSSSQDDDSNHTPTDLWDWKWQGIPTFLGSAMYGLEGITLTLPTVHSMRDHSKAIPVVSSAILSYGALTGTFAAVGYAGGLGGGPGTGRTREECDVVTDCITPHTLEVTVQISLSVALVLSLPVMLYPSTEMLEVMLTDWRKQKQERQLQRQQQQQQQRNVGNDSNYSSEISLPEWRDHDVDEEDNSSQSKEGRQLSRSDDEIEDQNGDGNSVTSNTDNEHAILAEEYSQEKSWRLRLFLAFVVVLLGSTTRSFTTYSSLVGSILLTFAGFVLPPILYMRALHQSRMTLGWGMKALLFLILTFGVFNMVVGGTRSIIDVVKGK